MAVGRKKYIDIYITIYNRTRKSGLREDVRFTALCLESIITVKVCRSWWCLNPSTKMPLWIWPQDIDWATRSSSPSTEPPSSPVTDVHVLKCIQITININFKGWYLWLSIVSKTIARRDTCIKYQTCPIQRVHDNCPIQRVHNNCRYSAYMTIARYSAYPTIARYSAYTTIALYSAYTTIARYSAYTTIARYSAYMTIARYRAYTTIARYSVYRTIARYSAYTTISHRPYGILTAFACSVQDT